MPVTQSPQQDSMGTLTDKVALVTAGTRGIGALSAAALHHQVVVAERLQPHSATSITH